MSWLSRCSNQSLLLLLFCSLLTVDIVLRVFEGDPAEATRIAGRETDAAITQLSGTYNQMSAANTALAASINRLSSELARLELDKWSKAEKALADSQELLAAAAANLANALTLNEATDSGETPQGEGSGESGSE
jgi:hypothetical protein